MDDVKGKVYTLKECVGEGGDIEDPMMLRGIHPPRG